MELLTSRVLLTWRENLIFVSVYTNLIAIVNHSSGEIIQTYEIDGEKFILGLFTSAFLIGDILVLAPYRAEFIHIVNLQTGEQRKISQIPPCVDGKYLQVVNQEERMWFIGENYSKIVSAALEDNNITFKHEYEYEKEIKWVNSYLLQDNLIIIPSRNANKLLLINCHNCEEKLIDVVNKTEENSEGFSDIVELSGRKLIWDSNGETYELFVNEQNAEIKKVEGYSNEKGWKSIATKNCLYRFSGVGNHIAVIFPDKIEVIKVKSNRSIDCSINYFQGACASGEFIYFQNIYGEVFKMNAFSQSLELMQINSNIDFNGLLVKSYRDEIDRVGLIKEKYINSLSAYLKMLSC